ncbi:MAG: adenylate/guanylate cyclase [Steroidobacteraceae bacterium]|nr:adenylate/guanylate cyclase [Steroidobacteraceae bacterium]
MSDQPQKILVVEDDTFFRGLLLRQLNDEGYVSVNVAEDGYQALNLLREDDIDLVLLDIGMPRLDGIGVLKQLKADTRLRSIPVIVISGVEEITSVVKCIELGAEQRRQWPSILERQRPAGRHLAVRRISSAPEGSAPTGTLPACAISFFLGWHQFAPEESRD